MTALYRIDNILTNFIPFLTFLLLMFFVITSNIRETENEVFFNRAHSTYLPATGLRTAGSAPASGI